jgi:Fe-S cluster assembly protein SufD
LADAPARTAPVLTYIRNSEGHCFGIEECEHALELARNTAVPSRLEEDWRRTDPDAFPWDRLEEVDPVRTKREILLRAMGGSAATGFEPLEMRDNGDRCRAMQIIAGDDYDAKFLYFHKALSQAPVCFRAVNSFRGEPVELLQKASGPGLATFTTVLAVERGAHVVLYDRWEAAGEAAAAIGRTEIIVEDGAHLVYLQDDLSPVPIYRRARIRLEREAKLEWFSVTAGAPWHVARLEVDLNGPGAEAFIRGLFAGSGPNRADHRTHQYHGAPNGKSELTMKTLLTGRAHSVYQGLITVPRPAQKTDAYQQCRNLLLEAGTHADAIPKLEIIADDVRCTHGASVGSVNKDQVFYLQSRGLTRKQATVAIASGFAEEIIRHVPVEPIQQRWRALVSRTIGAVKE